MRRFSAVAEFLQPVQGSLGIIICIKYDYAEFVPAESVNHVRPWKAFPEALRRADHQFVARVVAGSVVRFFQAVDIRDNYLASDGPFL